MKAYDYALEFIKGKKCQILEANCEKGVISFRYQLNTFLFTTDEEEDNFFMLVLSGFDIITEKNKDLVKDSCLNVNMTNKMAKMYTQNDCVVASAEVYFMEQADLDFQFENALRCLISAKVAYKTLAISEYY